MSITLGEQLLRENAPTVFTGYAARQLLKLNIQLDLLRDQYKHTHDPESRRALTFKADKLKKDIMFFSHTDQSGSPPTVSRDARL